MKYLLAFLSLISLNLFLSCTKSDTLDNLNQTQLDSVIMGNANLNFIYDSQDRVIKERLVFNDTLREENIYTYNAGDSSPYKRTHLNQLSFLNYVSYFTYNNNGYKVYDSTHYLSSGSNFITTLNYSLNQKICVLQKNALNWNSDTIYLNSNNNIDSIRHHLNITQPHGTLSYYGTSRYLQYNAVPNYFKTLSISRSNFYIPMPVENFGHALLQHHGYDFALGLDYVNQHYFTNLSVYSLGAGGMTSNYQKQIQFNSNNLPITETLFVGGTQYSQIRLVYK